MVRPIGQETWEWWDTEFSKLAAGFSDMGVVRGWWQGYSDVNRWIVLVVDGENEIGRIRAFLKNARRRFRQKAMYLEFHQVTFEEVA